MLKGLTRLEYQIVNRIYHFTFDPDSPIEHIKEVLFQFQKFVGQYEDQVKSQVAQQEAQAASQAKESAKVIEMPEQPKEEVKPAE